MDYADKSFHKDNMNDIIRDIFGRVILFDDPRANRSYIESNIMTTYRIKENFRSIKYINYIRNTKNLFLSREKWDYPNKIPPLLLCNSRM